MKKNLVSIISALMGSFFILLVPLEAEGKVNERPVYITIDDGPTEHTKAFLNVLNDYGMKATFFMLDPNMEEYHDAVRQMEADGHGLGCHGVTHERGEFYESPSSAVQEMQTCTDTLAEITGEYTDVIRVPYGSIPDMEEDYREAMREAGYKMWDWNVDPRDWDKESSENIIDAAINKVQEAERDGEIPVILLHDLQPTLQALPEILQWLQDNGYYSETITSYQDRYNFYHKINLEARVANRFAGKNRYETAIEISQYGWNYSDTVVIARGDEFPDALAGGPLAYKLDAPILLTHKDELLAEVRDELQRLRAKKAVILGGSNAISEETADAVSSMGIAVDRINGANRYETAVKIAERIDSDATTSVVANGWNFADALAIAPYAAREGYPILLTKKDELPVETREALAGKRETLVVGGESVVNEKVYLQLPDPERYAGKNRFATASEITRRLYPSNRAYVSTAYEFADALAGSVLAAKNNATMLLVKNSFITSPTVDAVQQAGINSFTILGGKNAVDYNVEDWFKNYDFESIRAAEGNMQIITK